MHGWMKQFHTPSIILAENVHLLKKSTLQLIKKTKNEFYRKMVDNATSQNIWSFCKWMTTNRTYMSPPLDQGEDSPPAVTHKEKGKTLQSHLFPKPPHLDNEQTPALNQKPDDIK